MRITPHQRQVWVDQERTAPPEETAEQRGQIIVGGTLAEGRSVVAMVLALRRDVPTDTACRLLAAAPMGLDAKAAQAWAGAIAYSDEMEIPQ